MAVGPAGRSRRRVAAAALVVAAVGATLAIGSGPARATPAITAVAPCTDDQSSGVYPPDSAQIGISRTQVEPGSQAVVSSNGWAPGTVVQLYLCSRAYALGPVTTSAVGTFSRSVTFPPSTTVGDHHVEAIGTSTAGNPQTLVTDVTVVGRGSTAPTGSTNSDLPFTGFDLVPLVLAALLLLGVGGALVVVGRQRLHQRT